MPRPIAPARLVLVLTAFFAVPARADVATDMTRGGLTRLFYVKDGAVARADCAGGAIAFDRNSCRYNVVDANEDALIAAVAGPDLRDLPDVERQMSEYWLNLARTQARIAELTTLPSGPDVEALRAAMAAAQRAVTEADGRIKDLDDQLARVAEALKAAPTDQDLIMQQRSLEAQHAGKARDRIDLYLKLTAARQAYIGAGAAGSDATYQGLVREYQRTLAGFTGVKSRLATLLTQAIDLFQLVSRIREQGYTFTHLGGEAVFTDTDRFVRGIGFPTFGDGLDDAFEGALRGRSYYNAAFDPRYGDAVVRIPKTGRVHGVSCRLRVEGEPTSASIDTYAPTATAFIMTFGGASFSAAEGDPLGLFGGQLENLWGQPAQGDWRFTAFPTNILGSRITGGTCTVQVD